MNVEMGESLVASWLKHVKGCQIVQTNWRPSWFLGETDFDFAEMVLNKLDANLSEIGISAFPRRKAKKAHTENGELDVRQILGMAECDVIGVVFCCGGEAKRFYAVESAFHSDGLHYRSTAGKVAAKLAKDVLSLHLNMGARDIEVGFMTPIVKDACYKEVKEAVQVVREFFTGEDCSDRFNCTVDLYTDPVHENDETEAGLKSFRRNVVRPLIMRVPLADDDSELFMRSMLMRELSLGYRLPVRSSLRSGLQTMHSTVEDFEKLPESRIDAVVNVNERAALKGYRRWMAACSLINTDGFTDSDRRVPSAEEVKTNNEAKASERSRNGL